jgi:uncharacterized membrane protein YeaQ/YmgE (transglycosylase-associated protein family)
MSIIAWLLLGLAAGFIGSKIVNNTGRGILGDIVVGVLGALFGGFLFTRLGAEGVTGLNLWSLLVATCGSVVLLGLYYALRPPPFGRWRSPPV